MNNELCQNRLERRKVLNKYLRKLDDFEYLQYSLASMSFPEVYEKALNKSIAISDELTAMETQYPFLPKVVQELYEEPVLTT